MTTKIPLMLAVAALIFVNGCSQFMARPHKDTNVQQETNGAAVPSSRIAAARKLKEEGRYEEAVEAYRAIMRDYPRSDWAATSLYDLASVYVLTDNPQKDYGQALIAFDEFISQYPRNKRIEEARSWRQVLKLVMDTKKENDRLSKNIERLKQLDMKQEEKRLGR